MKTIGILGGTGHLGRDIIAVLQERGYDPKKVVAFGRSTDKLDDWKSKGGRVKQIEYGDRETMMSAFEGIDVLCFISGSNADLQRRGEEHKNIIEAAKSAKVGHIVFISLMNSDQPNGSPLLESFAWTEKAVRDCGLPFTICRNGVYGEMGIGMVEEACKHGGFVTVHGGDEGFAAAMRGDLARAITTILLSPSDHNQKVYELTGPELVTPKDITELATNITGRRVGYEQVNDTVRRSMLMQSGMDRNTAEFMTNLDHIQGQMNKKTGDLERLMGSPPRKFHDAARQHFGTSQQGISIH